MSKPSELRELKKTLEELIQALNEIVRDIDLRVIRPLQRIEARREEYGKVERIQGKAERISGLRAEKIRGTAKKEKPT